MPEEGKDAEQNGMTAAEASRIYFLPNFFTAGNLFFGFVAIIKCIQAKYGLEVDSATLYTEAVWAIFIAFVCDALDGRVARLGGRESLFGKEFDSIADVISFGLAPALLVFFLILAPTEEYTYLRKIGWLIGFIYLLCAGVRLARFNVITHPLIKASPSIPITKDFLGLPVPVAAGFIASLAIILINYDLQNLSLFLPPLMIGIAWLMVSNIMYPSFKHIDWHTHTSIPLFVFLVAGGVILLIIFQETALTLLFLAYILYGPLRALVRSQKAKKLKQARND